MKVTKIDKNVPDDVLTFNNLKALWGNIGNNAEYKIEKDEDLKRQLSKESGQLAMTYLERALIGTGIKVALATDGNEIIHISVLPNVAMEKGIDVKPLIRDGELCLLIYSLSRQKKYFSFGERLAELKFLSGSSYEIR